MSLASLGVVAASKTTWATLVQGFLPAQGLQSQNV